MSAQKFNSIAKPLVRGTLPSSASRAQIGSLWELREGSSEEATYAREWAEWFELKHAVLHGFMADATSEAEKWIREWEPENSDLSSGCMENAWQFVETVTVLFEEKKVFDGATYGAYMIDTLRQRDFVIVFRDQTRKTLYSKTVIKE